MALTQKQMNFINEYLISGNGAQAAIRAGYSERSARSIASELIRKPAVAAELASRRAEVRKSASFTAREVADHLAAMAFASFGDLFHEDGRWKRLEELDPETRMAIKAVRKPPKVRAGERWPTTPFILPDKLKALDLLGAYMGYYPPTRGRPPGTGQRRVKGKGGGGRGRV